MEKLSLTKHPELLLTIILAILSTVSTIYYFHQGTILAYGDAESHINIAKRVVDSLTPGMAQLGGIWLPLPHILMIPFVKWDFLWHTGLAGSIVSGAAYIFAGYFIYKITNLLTGNKIAGLIGAFIFALNQNVLYLQATPMGELPLLAFFLASIFYLIKYFQDSSNIPVLIFAAFFAFCATLSRYDGWFLVLFEALAIIIFYFRKPSSFRELEGKLILFATLSFLGILLWFIWDGIILGDPLYFTSSPFSAKSQQNSWLTKGELPAYKNLSNSLAYYTVTSAANIGIPIAILSLLGLFIFLWQKRSMQRLLVILLLSVPFTFYVATLYIGQSVIFIPQLTPASFEWRLFNVRYGIMMVPFAAVFTAYFWSQWRNRIGKFVTLLLIAFGLLYYGLNQYGMPIVLADGTLGLSASKHPEAQTWLAGHYDYGLVLMDDYARTISIAKSNVPMNNMIYVGNKPYWEDSLKTPEKYARWIVMQKGDAIWNGIYENPQVQPLLYKYFYKIYTSPDILIFKRQA